MMNLWPPSIGMYAMRLVKGGPLVAVRIWYGHAIIDGEEQDRGYDFRCEIDGRTDRIIDGIRAPLDISEAWPFCARRPIDLREYVFLLRRRDWALEHDPSHPVANPRQPIDVRNLKPAF
jgi:hypothetical protein